MYKLNPTTFSPLTVANAGVSNPPASRFVINKRVWQTKRNNARALITQLICKIDQICTTTLNEILHHPMLQQLEASWLNLKLLTNQVHGINLVKIRMLDLSWQELRRDLSKAVEIEQSELFNRVYNQEFGMPGGEPFGVLVGDYDIRINQVNDIEALTAVSAIAAAAFVPFIAAVHPASLGVSNFADLARVQKLGNIFKAAEYNSWHNLRKSNDARFIGLVMPKVVLRAPHQRNNIGFAFHEKAYQTNHYLWGNASYTFASVLIKSFADSRWFIHLRGSSNQHNGGLVDYLPQLNFAVERSNIITRLNTEVIITDEQEKNLSELGFIALCQIKGSNRCVFYDNRSIQEPIIYHEEIANANAKISATLQYIFCASRFAHYIKVIGRDKIGSFFSHLECESYLNSWLVKYIAGNDDLTAEQKLNYPLRDARVQVKQHPGKPGQYLCVMHLQPRVQLEQIRSMLILVTELAPIIQ